MCLLAIAYKIIPETPLFFVGNRDEFLQRPTAPLKAWPEEPDILAGQDLEAMGTWTGVNQRTSVVVALTNIRNPEEIELQQRYREGSVSLVSRGAIVRELLSNLSEQANEQEIAKTLSSIGQTAGYNLFVYSSAGAFFHSNRNNSGPKPLAPGVYTLCNGPIDEEWPKMKTAKQNMASWVENSFEVPTSLSAAFDLLTDLRVAPETELPQTGVPLTAEKSLSSCFVQMPGYGTRLTTIVEIRKDGGIIAEQNWKTMDNYSVPEAEKSPTVLQWTPSKT